jgi:hypothetical protein
MELAPQDLGDRRIDVGEARRLEVVGKLGHRCDDSNGPGGQY